MQVRNAQGIVSAENNQAKRGMVLPFQPLSLAFNHVNYYVDMPAVSNLHIFPLRSEVLISRIYMGTYQKKLARNWK